MATQEYFGGDADEATALRKSAATTAAHARRVGRAYPMPPTSRKGKRPAPGVGYTHHLTPVEQSTVDDRYYYRVTAEMKAPPLRPKERIDGVDVTVERDGVMLDPETLRIPVRVEPVIAKREGR